jgi:AcrR family transcriptional regulator
MSTSPLTERPLRADARRNRAKVVAAARDVFAEHGLDAPMEEVARRAGVGVGTLYRHFPTKDALVLGTVQAKFERLADEARRLLAEEPDPWVALQSVLLTGGERNAADRSMAQVWNVLPPEVFATAAADSGLQDVAAELVARARAAGAVRPDLTVDDIPLVMCGLGGIVCSGHGAGWRRYLELVFDGMRARPAGDA